jgi:hypothetical protein
VRRRPLPAVVVLLLAELGQYVGRITAAAIGKASQLRRVTPIGRELDKLVDGVAAAGVGKAAQLVHVTPLACQLDKLVDGVSVTVCGSLSQVRQVLIISHIGHLSLVWHQPARKPTNRT